MNRKKRKYIAGKITGNDNYYLQFMEAEAELTASDTIVLNPAKTSARIDGLEHARIHAHLQGDDRHSRRGAFYGKLETEQRGE